MKIPAFALNKQAFDRTMSDYAREVSGSLQVEFRIDVENIVERVVKEQDRPWFWAAYRQVRPVLVEQEIVAQSLLGDRRHVWEQRIGERFRAAGVYPLARYAQGQRCAPAPVADYQMPRATMTLLPPTAAVEVTHRTEEWMEAHHIAHCCEATQFAPHQPEAPLPRVGYVYFMYDPDKPSQVKIGCAEEPSERLKTARTWCPAMRIILQIPTTDMFAAEWSQHACWVGERRENSEWFFLSKNLREFIRSSGGEDVA